MTKQYTTFDENPNNVLEENMFLGQNVNVSRYDQQKLNAFDKLIEKQLSFFWRPDEIDVSKDRLDWKSMTEAEQHIFISNMKYQILLDSMAARSVNMVLLPLVSLPEVETWVETWAFSECLAEGTEVLTDKGWKDLADTTTEDPCLVYNLEDDSVFFEKPKRVVEYDMDTKLVHYQSSNPKQFDQLVTPNHRMPVIHRDVKEDGTQTRYFKEAMFQDYQPNHLAPISGYLKTKGEGITPVEALRIAIQADGTMSERYTGGVCGTIPVWFNLTKQRKIDRLIRIVEDCGFELVKLADDKRDSSKRFKVNLPVSHNMGNSKTFDWVDLSNIGLNWCKSFLEELSEWDSHIIKDSFTYSTVIKSNADTVQAICSLCGKSPRMTIKSDDRKESYQDLYSINVINKHTKDGQSINAKYVDYKGKVRCLETTTGAFLIRYNGVVSVTGNTIHSRSYTHILRNLFVNPSEVFDDIVVNPEILKRASSIAKYFDDVILTTQFIQSQGEGVYQVNGKDFEVTQRKLKERLYLAVCSVNALEAIRFYVSFACSFAFAERKLLEGNAKIIKLIARDEALHLTGTQMILNNWRNGKDDPEMEEISKELRQEGIDIFMNVVQEEKEWANYLFKDGSMIGLNKEILNQYIEYIANHRMHSLGFEKPFDINSNPIPWMSTHLSSDNVQVAPQETEISSYLVGQVDSSVSKDDFDEFSL